MRKPIKKSSTARDKRASGLVAVLQAQPATAGLVLVVAAIVIYANSLGGQLVFDDTVIIQGNRAIQGLDGEHLKEIFGGHYWQAVESRGGLYRPIVMFTYALNYVLDGEDPQGYHLLNVLLHAANGVLVYLVLQALFSRREISFLTALLFALHPIRTEGVASVVGRAEVLSAFFMLLSWYAYLKNRKERGFGWLWLSSGLFLLAALSKESAVIFVALLPLTDFVLHRQESQGRLGYREAVMRYLPFGLAVFLVLGLRYWILGGFAPLYINPASNPLAKADAWARFLTATNVFARYLVLLVFPLNLSADYSYNQIPVVSSLLSWSALAALLLLVFLLIGLVIAVRKHLVLFFSGCVFFVSFALTSNWIRPIGTIMAERLMYFPALGFNCAVAYLLAEGVAHARWKSAAAIAIVVLVAAYGLRTIDRNPDWKSNYTLFRSAAETSPNSELVQANYGVVLLEANDVRGAIEHAKKAAEIKPDDPAANFTLGRAYRRLGNLPESASAFEKVVLLAPRTSGGTEALLGLAEIREAMEQYPLAEAGFRKLIEWQSSIPSYYLKLYSLYKKMGRADQAYEILNRVARIAPDDAAVRKALQEFK